MAPEILDIICWGNGMSPFRHQVITGNGGDVLLTHLSAHPNPCQSKFSKHIKWSPLTKNQGIQNFIYIYIDLPI